MTNFQFSDEDLKTLNSYAEEESGSTLPRHIPVFWWRNGTPGMEKILPALGTGGWYVKVETMNHVLDALGDEGMPAQFQYASVTNRDGEESDIYIAQNLLISKVAHRQAWMVDDAPPYHKRHVPGARHALQYLVWIAYKDTEGNITPWGPAVLAVRGYQTGYLSGARKDWGKYTKEVREELTEELRKAGRWEGKRLFPADLFYAPIGSFGKKPVIEKVGKSQQSPINPIRVYQGKGLTLDKLKGLYVGKDTLAEQAKLIEEVQEWLHEWDEDAAPAPTQAPASEPEPEYHDMGEEPF